ncbi:MAG: release factor glutamine methyltransferase [Epulopiscium sp.]|uniref:Release factor glutamine methyltransferase n=1 Tax=Defluviitalea raffinosedens TaxID=1450156 RepID=A0A7C8LR80_9FIRM|nr:peptide chain release factor N(5)-glutamine methyltransferase [Defluviitalea raffinosedens]KAE9636301.1 peptide chain release factor N(5)-glutamine methyltransferase [Defluviitalea raffinosedens]MBM7685396.1 release factor glutamine methyltransferase [Defluviitalea raffinosedens]MDK2788112.1 release factor glutamine methyltransferase [Candidatus Epulonipiscium sp.]
MKKTIEKVLAEGKALLKDAHIRTWALDGEILLSHVLSFSRVQLFTHSKDEISEEQEKVYKDLIYRRLKGTPTQYLTNEQEFMSLPFYVNNHVLIPRQDTEILVETALELIDRKKEFQVLDVCTGSGCIGISIAYYAPLSRVIGIDISEPALNVAEHNAKLNQVNDRVHFIKSNLFKGVPEDLKGTIDMIVSNPPYIPTDEIKGLMKEVSEYEPTIALDGGKDGLDFYRFIVKDGKEYLKSGGILLFEIGYNQGDEVAWLLKSHGFNSVEIKKDLAGLNRVVFGIKE